MEDVVDAFSHIVMRTECVFAKSAKLIGPPKICPSDVSVEDYVNQYSPLLFDFCHRLETEHLDGFVLAFSSQDLGASVETVTELLRKIVRTLALSDLDASRSVSEVDLLHPDWRFKCCGRDFFISIFARCYDTTSSRHGFGSAETFVHLQPSETFTRHRPPNQDRIPEAVRELIRNKYASAGRGYDTSLHVNFSQALRFVSPTFLGGGSILWWKE